MKFQHDRGQDKLYKQWVEHGALAPDASPLDEDTKKEVIRHISAGRERKGPGLLLYTIFGLAVVVLATGLLLLLARSC